MFTSLKDKSVSIAAKVALGLYLKPYGEVQELRLDSKEKTLLFTIRLKGECEVLEVLIRDYRITKNGQQDVLIARHIETSRQWLNTVAEFYASERPIPVSPNLAMALHVLA